MIVYVESNFVLETALVQDQHGACEEILRLAKRGSIELAVPAYAVVEPNATLFRRHKGRRLLHSQVSNEFRQLTRTRSYQSQRTTMASALAFLMGSIEEETERLAQTMENLLAVASVIPLDASVVALAAQCRSQHALPAQDAAVYASVLRHLQTESPAISCFLNRDLRDFDDPSVAGRLQRHNCKLLYSFDGGLGFVRSQLTPDP